MPGYELLAPLGQGGMGVVYKARQVALNRPVALKMVHGTGPVDPKSVIRFLAEAESVAAVTHPHVVRIFDYGEAGGRPFMALEFLPGGTLSARLREHGRLPPRAAAELVERLARGVQAAHDRGIVHRDLKPANVLFDADGTPKVADFGLAKRAEADGDLTRTGAVMGTPSYMSPEQAKGETKFVGPAADVWALGVILYECLTGAKPFQGPDTWAVVKQVMEADPAPPRARAADVPRDLDRVCRACLAKDPADRYPTAAALADDLLRFLRGEPVAVRRPGLVERGYKWARRNPARATANVLLGLVVLVGSAAGGAVWLWREAARARDTEHELSGQLRILKEDLADQVYYRRIDVAQRNWYENHVLRSLRELAAADPDRRNWEWRYVARLCASELRALRPGDYVGELDLSPDGRRVVTPVDDRTVRVWDVDTGGELARHTHSGSRHIAAVFHPDGRRVVSASADGSAHVWDAATGATLREWTFPNRPAGATSDENMCPAVAVGRDGTVAVGTAVGPILLFRADTGEPLGRLDGHQKGLGVHHLRFAPDGRRLYSASMDGTVRTWDVAKLAEAEPARDHGVPVYAVAFGPDGRLWTGDDNGRLRRWDANDPEGRKKPAVLEPHDDRLWSIAFSPDGRYYLTGSLDQTARLWEVTTDKLVRTFRGHTDDVMSAVFVAGGTRVLTAGDRTIRVWDATRDAEARTLAAPGPVETVVFGPDGRWVAAATPAGIVAWDVATAGEVCTWGTGGGESGRAVAFRPDGGELAGGGPDGKVRVWPLAGGPPRAWDGRQGGITAVAYGPAGDRLASAGADGVVRVWDAHTGRELWSQKADAKDTLALAFSPDGTHLATGGEDRVVRVWDAATGSAVFECPGHTVRVMRVAFSRDGTRLASASNDNTLRIWDARTGDFQRQLRGHAHYLYGVDWTPDGRRVADAAGDRTVKLYDGRTGQEVLTLKGHGGEVHGLAFSPDGTRLATGGLDGVVRVWEAPADAAATVPPEADESFKPD